jgi:uncharacterized protein YabE (DUF348 family)
MAVLRRPAALVLPSVLLLALLGAAVAWTTSSKTVSLAVDGQPRSVDFRGSTVADVLSAAGLHAGEHDTLVPGAATPVADGDRVALRRGRPLQLVVDGQPRTVWVTALSVDEALQQLDLRQEGLAVSASRSRPIPLSGLSLEVRTPKGLTVNADGRTVPVTSAAATVKDVLAEAGVQLGAQDRVEPAVDTPVTPGLVVTVKRVRTEQSSQDVQVPFAVQQQPDGTMTKGTTRVVTPGRNGVTRRTTAVTYVDGAVESSTASTGSSAGSDDTSAARVRATQPSATAVACSAIRASIIGRPRRRWLLNSAVATTRRIRP